jgi:hypothetical protein
MCSEISAEQAEEIQRIITENMEHCPACKDRGLILFKHPLGYLDHIPCPCGGDDENRIVLDDFGGAA